MTDMAWSWSHTDEAYLYAYKQIRTLPRETLIEIVAEWEMHDRFSEAADFVWANEWPKVLTLVKSRYESHNGHIVLDQRIIGDVWTRAFGQQTCDDGGFNAWLCPYGCGPHCVPFGPEEAVA